MAEPTRVYFHERQLDFRPRLEWAGGETIAHPETAARAEAILAAVESEPEHFCVEAPAPVPAEVLRAVHSEALLAIYTQAEALDADAEWHPPIFPKRGALDPTNLRHAGAWCLDSGTPLSAATRSAATWSAACALDAARTVGGGAPLAYALSRPPGHHAEEDLFGGYCYFNNSALAAEELRRGGARVVVLDVDFHHGNGTQRLFESNPDVLTVSLHGDPRRYFPYSTGYAEERGVDEGRGTNLNLVLEARADGQAYLAALEAHALPAIRAFAPDFLVLAAGLDAYVEDPIGDFALTTEDFLRVGERVGALGLPVVAVQEGGYFTPHLGRNALALLHGLRDALTR